MKIFKIGKHVKWILNLFKKDPLHPYQDKIKELKSLDIKLNTPPFSTSKLHLKYDNIRSYIIVYEKILKLDFIKNTLPMEDMENKQYIQLSLWLSVDGTYQGFDSDVFNRWLDLVDELLGLYYFYKDKNGVGKAVGNSILIKPYIIEIENIVNSMSR
jgi:hypothetical protein